MFSNAINKKTKEYIEALSDTEEVKVYKKALAEFEEDSEAKKLLSDFQESQRTYAIFRQGGFAGINEVEQKLRDLNGRLSKNRKIQSLIKSQQDLQSLVGGMVDDISRGINFPFVKPQQGSCCG